MVIHMHKKAQKDRVTDIWCPLDKTNIWCDMKYKRTISLQTCIKSWTQFANEIELLLIINQINIHLLEKKQEPIGYNNLHSEQSPMSALQKEHKDTEGKK